MIARIEKVVYRLTRRTPRLYDFLWKTAHSAERLRHSVSGVPSRPSEFPLREGRSTWLDTPMTFSDMPGIEYHTRFVAEAEPLVPNELRRHLNYMTETVVASSHPAGEQHLALDGPALVPLAAEEDVVVDATGAGVDAVVSLVPHRFRYLPTTESGQLRIQSSKPFVVGRPIPTTGTAQDGRRSIVVCLFLDGLPKHVLDESGFDNLMPQSAAFFESGMVAERCYATAEWTLPSVTSMLTSQYASQHGVYHPNSYTASVPAGDGLLGRCYQDAGYVTTNVGGNWRATPSYGHVKGFDRMVYAREMAAHRVADTAVETLRALPGRDHFLWLTFMELHHRLGLTPGLSADALGTPARDRSELQRADDKSVYHRFSARETDVLRQEIQRLDHHLGLLYGHLEALDENVDLTVALVSDHGQGYVSQYHHPLSPARRHVPFMLRSPSVAAGTTHEVMDNTDIVPTLLRTNGIEVPAGLDGNVAAFLGGPGREEAFAESIYPGQTYKAATTDGTSHTLLEAEHPVTDDGRVVLGEPRVWSLVERDGEWVEAPCSSSDLVETVRRRTASIAEQ